MAKLNKISFLLCLCVVLSLDGAQLIIQGPPRFPIGGSTVSSGGKILQEGGGGIKLENGSTFLLKEYDSTTATNLLLESGSIFLLENGSKLQVEH
jgi:hypothetical protein